MQLVYTPTRSQTADILTKALPRTESQAVHVQHLQPNLKGSAEFLFKVRILRDFDESVFGIM